MLQKVCLALALATAAAAGDCKASTLDFVMLEGEASHDALDSLGRPRPPSPTFPSD